MIYLSTFLYTFVPLSPLHAWLSVTPRPTPAQVDPAIIDADLLDWKIKIAEAYREYSSAQGNTHRFYENSKEWKLLIQRYEGGVLFRVFQCATQAQAPSHGAWALMYSY